MKGIKGKVMKAQRGVELYFYSLFNLGANWPRVLGETVILGFRKRVKYLDNENKTNSLIIYFFCMELIKHSLWQ
jgi:ATP/ADP translocase